MTKILQKLPYMPERIGRRYWVNGF